MGLAVETVHKNFTRSGLQETGQDSQDGRFARAILGPKKPTDLPLFDPEGDILNRKLQSIEFSQNFLR